MTVYDYVDLFTDLFGIVITVWDLDGEKRIFDSRTVDGGFNGSVDIPCEIGCYEVSSVDLFKTNDDRIALEINISTEEVDWS